MTLSETGHILAVSGWAVSGQGPMITVLTDSGRVIETQPAPYPVPTNICFGGSDLSDLYLTAGDGCLYRVADSGYRGAERYRR